MTLQTQTTVNAPATLTDEQRRRVSDALENAQSENTRKNYASQFGKFRTWCEQEDYSHLPEAGETAVVDQAPLGSRANSSPMAAMAPSIASTLTIVSLPCGVDTPYQLPREGRPSRSIRDRPQP